MLVQAYAWVCSKQLERSYNNSIWDPRYNWSTIKLLLQELRTAQYFLSHLRAILIILGSIFKHHPLYQLKDGLLVIKIGKIELQSYYFSGVPFGARPTRVKAILKKHLSRLAQRYPQGASRACIGDYVERWTSWCSSVLMCCEGAIQSNQPKGPSRYPQSYSCLGNHEKHSNGTKWLGN